MMKKNLNKVEAVIKQGSPELKRAAEEADKARQEYRKSRKAMMKALGKDDISTSELRKKGRYF